MGNSLLNVLFFPETDVDCKCSDFDILKTLINFFWGFVDRASPYNLSKWPT